MYVDSSEEEGVCSEGHIHENRTLYDRPGSGIEREVSMYRGGAGVNIDNSYLMSSCAHMCSASG